MSSAAAALVRAAMIHSGDRVIISGPVDDTHMLEVIALQVMKVGGQPLITVGSNALARASYDSVAATYDTASPGFGLALTPITDAVINVEYPTDDSLFKGIPEARMAARARTGQVLQQAYFAHPARSVNLGNGLYPWPGTGAVFGKSDAEFADMFWKAVAVSPDTLRAIGNKVMTALRNGKSFRVTAPNGTDVTFVIEPAKGFISDGQITADKIKQGAAAMATWLPAGEVLEPLDIGSATGKVVVDKTVVNGVTVEGLTLTFDKGKLTNMTASAGLDAIKQRYDAASGSKDVLSAIDFGLNPAIALPVNTGKRVVWMGAGNVTLVMGDNRSWAGSNSSDFSVSLPVTSPTMTVDGTSMINGGKIQ